MKKILSLVLAMLMIFSMVPAVFAAETSEDSDYAEALDFLAAVGFYKGGAGVADDDLITRWQMALFVSRLITGEVEDSYWATTENDSGFTDVADLEAYMLGAVTFASQEGIINGYGDGTYGPNDNITYRDALVMVVRALGTKYSAAGYPWSYISTAREWGLMNDMGTIGWTDELTRAQVAQILYNAFFAEVKGTTVAEKVFGIAEDLVMVTASNRVVYLKDATPVLATNYVQVMAVDEQLEPAGTAYHIPAAALDLNDDNAENGAVGGLYSVWHRDNFKTIVMYEDLNTTYTRRPGAMQFSLYGSSVDNRGITIDGKVVKLVQTYTNLFNQDRPNRTAAGTPEIKMFEIGAGGVAGLQTIGTLYVMYPDGWIYTIATLSPVGYYSEYLDTWYQYTAGTTASNGTYTKIDITNPNDPYYGIYSDLHRGNDGGRKGFGLANNGTANTAGVENWYMGFSGYADLETSDADKDGYADRAVLKNYKIGQYFEYYRDSNNSWEGYYFNIITNTNKTTAGNKVFNANAATQNPWYTDMNAFAVRGYTDDGDGVVETADSWNTAYFKPSWNFVNAPKNGDYIVYYIDDDNDELDVIKTIPQKSDSTTDTYWSYGYVLGFFQTQNKIYMNDGETRTPLNIGYDAMFGFGSPLYSFNYNYGGGNAYSKAEFAANLSQYLLPFVEGEVYVKYLVLDGNVIMIESTTADSGDYVIIDSYADISADGIKVNAWSTVTDSYDVITIAEFNGWDIDGVEWDALWQTAIYQAFATGKMPSMNDLLKQYVPIEFGRVYSVVSHNDKDYNISTSLRNVQNDVDVVVAGGYVHNQTATYSNYVKLDGTSANILETAANDFWLVKELKTDGTYKVYGRTGRLANVVFGDLTAGNLGVTVYKADASSRDFVIEGTTAALDSFLKQVDTVDSNKIRYAVYEGKNLNQSQEDFEYNAGSYYRQTFRDVISGEYFVVDYDAADSAKEAALRAAVTSNPTNTIYKIVDGKLLSAEGVDMAEVAAVAAKSYTNSTTWTATAATTLANLMVESNIALERAVVKDANGMTITYDQAAARDYIHRNNLTYIYLDTADSYYYGVRYSGTQDQMNDNATNTGRKWNMQGEDNLVNAKAYIFWNTAATESATKATVFVDYGAATGSTTVATAVGACTTPSTGAANTDVYEITVAWECNDNITPETATVTISGIAWADAACTLTVNTAVQTITSVDVSGALTFTLTRTDVTSVFDTYTFVLTDATDDHELTFTATIG